MALPEDCPGPERLDAWLSGTLPDDERGLLVAHLDACASCREELDRRLPAVEVLGGLTPGAGGLGEARGPALGAALASLKRESPADPQANQTTERAPAGETTVAGSPPPRPTTPGPREDVKFVAHERGGDAESSGRIGPYEVTERVGRGGMGEVFRAIDPALERVVAVKILAPALAGNPESRRRFLREARAAAAVCHEHVVTIHAVGESGDVPYLIMQFVAGRSLQEKIDREAPLGLKETLRIGMQVALGLAAAHAQGLVHRDIKPANILLENGVERVKITDFGLARAASDPGLTRSGTVVGTPNYMSPEQAGGEAVGPRSDLFSLGGVLYAMATGEPPFSADSAVAVLRRVCDHAPRPIRELNPETPDWLVATIERLMSKQPEGRFATAEEVAELLRGRLAELQGAAPPRPLQATARRWVVWATIAPLSLAALIACIALFAHLRPDRTDRRIEVPSIVPASSGERLTRGLEYSKVEDWTRALAELDAAIRLAPENTAAYEARAFARLRSGDFHGAIADCDQALRLDPGRANAYLNRGAALNGLGEWGRARDDFDEYIRRVPREPWSHYHRGYCRLNQGDNDGAVTDFDLAIELSPDVARFYGERALARARRRDLKPALADVERALLSAPENRGDLRLRGWIRAMSGDFERAWADYQLALEGQPMDVVTLADRASIAALVGHYELAEADFEEVLRREPSSAWIRARRALYLHEARGDHKRAIADCDAALKLSPGNAEASLNRGLALLALGDFRPAIADFNMALDANQKHFMTFLGPFSFRYPELYRARSEARRQLGDLKGALDDLDAALGLNPNDADLYRARGDVRAALGDNAGADADRLRAKEIPAGGAVR
jgi:serine/threonine protein kinase/regulator of sirC expression with transglutaminase-like and TPR domain